MKIWQLIDVDNNKVVAESNEYMELDMKREEILKTDTMTCEIKLNNNNQIKKND